MKIVAMGFWSTNLLGPNIFGNKCQLGLSVVLGMVSNTVYHHVSYIYIVHISSNVYGLTVWCVREAVKNYLADFFR